MTNCALVNGDTGEVKSFFMPAEPEHYPEGSTHSGLVVRWDTTGTFEGHAGSFISEYYHDGEVFVKRPVKPHGVYNFDWVTKEWVFNFELFISAVRQIRDGYLAASDWSQLSDAPLAESDKYKWQEYRQALRDLPETIDGIHAIDQIDWPVRP